MSSDPRDKKVPASKVVSNQWFVRIDGEESFLRQQCEAMAKELSTTIFHAVYHVGARGENPHVHFIHMHVKPVQKQSYDLIIKKRFNVAGTSYSTKVWDGLYEGAGSYLYHESNDSPVMGSAGLEEIHINAMKEHATKWRAIIVEKKKKASVGLVQHGLEYFSESPPDNLYQVWLEMHRIQRREAIYYPGPHVMKKFTIEVYSKVCTEYQWDLYAAEEFERVFFTKS